MNYLKKVGLSLFVFFIFIFISTFILTIFNYFNLINIGIVSIFQVIISIISILISGFLFGKKSNKKGLIEGLKLSFIIIFILFIMNIIFKNNFEIKNIIYYLILIFTCTIGSIIGINKNVENN